MALIETTAPFCDSNSSSSGIAVISFDFSSAATYPSVSPSAVAHALSIGWSALSWLFSGTKQRAGGGRMATMDWGPLTSDERLVAVQAVLNLRMLNAACDAAPDGAVLGIAELLSL